MNVCLLKKVKNFHTWVFFAHFHQHGEFFFLSWNRNKSRIMKKDFLNSLTLPPTKYFFLLDAAAQLKSWREKRLRLQFFYCIKVSLSLLWLYAFPSVVSRFGSAWGKLLMASLDLFRQRPITIDWVPFSKGTVFRALDTQLAFPLQVSFLLTHTSSYEWGKFFNQLSRGFSLSPSLYLLLCFISYKMPYKHNFHQLPCEFAFISSSSSTIFLSLTSKKLSFLRVF